MARMYPQPIHPDTRSHAERKLYAAFQSQLPDDFAVFHSVCWQVRDTTSSVRDGEADFVVAHPDSGILIVEVKGGRVRYDGQTGQWYSNENAIKDPFQQGREGKYSLLDKLKELAYWRGRWVTVGYAAAFPDVAVKGDLRLDAPRELILDGSDMADLAVWVDRALRYLRGRRPDDRPLGARGVEELIAFLSPSWDLQLLLSRDRGRKARTGPFDQRAVHHVGLFGSPSAGGHQRLRWFRQDNPGRRKGQAIGRTGVPRPAHLLQRQPGRVYGRRRNVAQAA